MRQSMLVPLILVVVASPALAQSPASPPGCKGPEYRQFDFWVGDWNVYPTGSNSLVAHSKIEALYSGCAVRENWMPLSGGDGGSLNSFDPATGRWHQTWIGSAPNHRDFDGGLVGNQMVLTGFSSFAGGAGKPGYVRIIYTPNKDGSVRQHGQLSYDEGLSWQDSYDFTYRRRTSSEVPSK